MRVRISKKFFLEWRKKQIITLFGTKSPLFSVLSTYPKKCNKYSKKYPQKLVFRDVEGPKIDPWRPKSPLGVSRAWK